MATAPLADNETRDVYTATSGQTVFPYTFWIKAETDLDVYVNEVLQTITTDYTVDAVQSVTGANVTFGTGLTLNDEVVITVSPDIKRVTEFSTSGQFTAAAINLELTYLVYLLQYLRTRIDRSFILADSSTSTADLSIPTPVANQVLGWNAAESALVNYAFTNAALVGNYDIDTFNGDSAETDFTLSFTAGNQGALLVSVDGVIQLAGTDFTLSGTTLTFTTAPDTGTDNIFVVNLSAGVAASTPANNSVGATQLQTDAVTTVKVTDNAITNAKLDEMAANTVKVNATASSADPTDFALSASELLGRGSSGNLGAITLGTGLSLSGTVLSNSATAAPSVYRSSTGATITVSSSDAFAHGLGAEPDGWSVIIECTDAGGDQGYAQGDRVDPTGAARGDVSRNISVEVDATNVTVYISGGGIGVLNKSTKAGAAIDVTKWELHVKAWVFN